MSDFPRSQGFQGRRVLVTGGTGFIGSHLVRLLLREGARVSALVRSPSRLSRLEPVHEQIKVVPGDLGSVEWADSVEAPEFVFHLAAHGVERPLDSVSEAIEANVRGTCNLVGVAAQRWRGLSSLVYTGTDFEYGPGEGARPETQELRPPNYYAASKAAGWLMGRALAQVHEVPIIGARPFITYGPDQGDKRLVPSVILAALRGEDFPLTGCVQVRDFVFVEDVAQGLLRAALAPPEVQARGEVFNLGSGVGTSLQTVVERCLELAGSQAKPLFGAIPYRKGEIWELYADASKSREVLGWSARTTLDEGLSRTIEWYREHL